MIGHLIGNYRILEKLGDGGMGEVFKGVDLMLDRIVAIKVIRPELAKHPEIVERFRAEAVALDFQSTLQTVTLTGLSTPIAPARINEDQTRLPPRSWGIGEHHRAGSPIAEPTQDSGQVCAVSISRPYIPYNSKLTLWSIWRDHPLIMTVLSLALGATFAVSLYWLLKGEVTGLQPESGLPASSRPLSLPSLSETQNDVGREVSPSAVEASTVSADPAVARRSVREQPARNKVPKTSRTQIPIQAVKPTPAEPSTATKPPPRKLPLREISRIRTPAKSTDAAPAATNVRKLDENRQYFNYTSEDIEKFLEGTEKPRPTPSRTENNGDYFESLSKDVETFIRK